MATPKPCSKFISCPRKISEEFVRHYYNVFHSSPESLHIFYGDSSELTCPALNGVVTTFTNIEAIKEHFDSMVLTRYKADIVSVDAYLVELCGVSLLITGSLTGENNFKRKFVRSVFLRHGEGSLGTNFTIKHEILRYVDGFEEPRLLPIEVITDEPAISTILTTGPSEEDLANDVREIEDVQLELLMSQFSDESLEDGTDDETEIMEDHVNVENQVKEYLKETVEAESQDSLDDESYLVDHQSAFEKDQLIVGDQAEDQHEVKNYQSNEWPAIVKDWNEWPAIVKAKVDTPSLDVEETNSKEDASKSSYASMLRSIKVPNSVENPATPKVAPVQLNAPTSTSKKNIEHGYSIQIERLPLNVTVAQIAKEFETYGPIMPGGIQIDTKRRDGRCIGFVKYKLRTSMEKAIKAKQVSVGGRLATVTRRNISSRSMFKY